jgi:hypothetical protein
LPASFPGAFDDFRTAGDRAGNRNRDKWNGDAESGVTQYNRPEAEGYAADIIKALRSEIPVMIPGRLIGSNTSREMVSPPAKLSLVYAPAEGQRKNTILHLRYGMENFPRTACLNRQPSGNIRQSVFRRFHQP